MGLAEGPQFSHKDPIVFQEFENAYNDIRAARRLVNDSGFVSTSTYATFTAAVAASTASFASAVASSTAALNSGNTNYINNSPTNQPNAQFSISTATVVQLNVTAAKSGDGLEAELFNTSNTASSDASISIFTGGSSAGDAYVRYGVAAVSNWVTGLDNSDSDAYVISSGLAVGTNNVVRISDAGEINQPLQPSFLVDATGATDVTGDATAYTVDFDTEIFDQGGDFNSTTNTFTAPIGGRYFFCASAEVGQVAAAHTTGRLRIITSNRNYDHYIDDILTAFYDFNVCSFADMDVNDTATVTVTISGSTKTVDLIAGASTKFSGSLIN